MIIWKKWSHFMNRCFNIATKQLFSYLSLLLSFLFDLFFTCPSVSMSVSLSLCKSVFLGLNLVYFFLLILLLLSWRLNMMGEEQSVLWYCGFFPSWKYPGVWWHFHYSNCILIVTNKKSGVSIAVKVKKICDISWNFFSFLWLTIQNKTRTPGKIC